MIIRSIAPRVVVLYDENDTLYSVPAYGNLDVPDELWEDLTFRKWVRWKFRDIDLSSANHIMEDPMMDNDNIIQPMGDDMDSIHNLRLRRASEDSVGELLRWETHTPEKLGAIHLSGQLEWVAANEQTTVGSAGGASALPATPRRYLKVRTSDGLTLVVPAYNS